MGLNKRPVWHPSLTPLLICFLVVFITERNTHSGRPFLPDNDHVTQSALYPILQSAYRLGHSTETALLKIQNDILAAMDNQRVTLLVLLDLSAAFDTIGFTRIYQTQNSES